MKNNFTKTNLFSCPIYKIRVDPDLYDKEKILKDIKYNKSFKNTRNEPHQIIGSPSDIHHSYRDHNNVNFRIINYKKLIDAYLKIFKEFFNNEIHTKKIFKFNFNILNYSAVTEGQWLPNHNHFGSDDDFACIHYLNFKNDHALTRFHNPAIFAPFIKYIRPEMDYILNNKITDNSYFYRVYEFPVEEDDMIIFPVALNHEVHLQGPTKEPRITISSNIKMTAKHKAILELDDT